MRKYAGTRLSSQKRNQWTKLRAVNVPNMPASRKSSRETNARVFAVTRHDASNANEILHVDRWDPCVPFDKLQFTGRRVEVSPKIDDQRHGNEIEGETQPA